MEYICNKIKIKDQDWDNGGYLFKQWDKIPSFKTQPIYLKAAG